MSEITVNYKGSSIATMNSNGTKTLETGGRYCEDDIEIVYTRTNGSARTPATTINTTPSFSYDSSTGIITAINSKAQDITPTVSAGYISSGIAGTITVSGSKTFQTRCIVGSFTTGSSTGTEAITLPYTGNGYPISVSLCITGGYNANSAAWTTINRYGIVQMTMVKAVIDTAPVHGTSSSNTADQGFTQTVFKNSTTDSTALSRNSSQTTATYINSDATGAVHTAFRLKTNTLFQYYVKGTSYGLLPSTSYTYIIVYSV